MTTRQLPAAPITSDPAPEKSPRPRRRRIKRVLGYSALALAGVAWCGYLWLDATSDVHSTGQAECSRVSPVATAAQTKGQAEKDHAAVCGVLDSMADAWDRNDADAYGGKFTENATYTTFVGTHYTGRKDIADAHRALFDGFLDGSKLADSFLDIRFLSPDTAVVTSRGDTYTGDEPDELSKIQTYTLVREPDGEWRIAAFHNTQRQSVMERVSFLFSPDTRPEAEK
ncbi:SgcJ/EcaC family oxidoreductase [Streptomyces sp. NPDC059849]|uniref:SgcJ/EcaC family oxidoreductase n=1 Tax=Streptomyces sp. NPDC059849 TaxID=3346969 RepID=UPI0036562F6D